MTVATHHRPRHARRRHRLVVRAIIRDRREIRRLEEAERETRPTLVAYHARRSQEIAQALDALGDDAQHVFPPSHDGR